MESSMEDSFYPEMEKNLTSLRFRDKIPHSEFNKRVEELVTNFSILPKDAVHIVRDFEHSYYADPKDAEKDFKVKIKEAQRLARRKHEKTSFFKDPVSQTQH